MNWKEKLDMHISENLVCCEDSNLRVIMWDFISTEIIEKLIEDIPKRIDYINGIEEQIFYTQVLKQQLKDKWL